MWITAVRGPLVSRAEPEPSLEARQLAELRRLMKRRGVKSASAALEC